MKNIQKLWIFTFVLIASISPVFAITWGHGYRAYVLENISQPQLLRKVVAEYWLVSAGIFPSFLMDHVRWHSVWDIVLRDWKIVRNASCEDPDGRPGRNYSNDPACDHGTLPKDVLVVEDLGFSDLAFLLQTWVVFSIMLEKLLPLVLLFPIFFFILYPFSKLIRYFGLWRFTQNELTVAMYVVLWVIFQCTQVVLFFRDTSSSFGAAFIFIFACMFLLPIWIIGLIWYVIDRRRTKKLVQNP